MSKEAPRKRGYVPPPEVKNAMGNKYYAKKFANPRIPSNCDHSLPRRDPVHWANSERGPQHFVVPLVPKSHPQWAGKREQPSAPEYSEPQVFEEFDDTTKYMSFDQYKNSRTFEDYYPGLFKAPHKVFPGRLFGTAWGSFDWWRSKPVFPGRLFGTAWGSFDWWRSKPDFDYWNVSNNPRGSWFRHEKVNSSGDAVGPRIIPSREIRRLPPTDEGASRGAFQTKPDADSAQAKKELKRSQSIPIYSTPPVAVGFTPLCRKFVPPIPRFPLQIDARGELVPTFGQFEPINSMRKQVPNDFVQTARLSARSSRSTASGSSRGSGRAASVH